MAKLNFQHCYSSLDPVTWSWSWSIWYKNHLQP